MYAPLDSRLFHAVRLVIPLSGLCVDIIYRFAQIVISTSNVESF
jgi:hypothetical protein